ncbi:MAG: DNRLRE domain-containing protein [Verrucomicrobiales bacterium]|nr:DNRLRE domain-containing protein [Verrucomicrobiales bacterium]
MALIKSVASTLSLEPSADVAILEYRPDFNLGAQDDLPAGTLGVLAGTTRSRVLLRFDLTPLPSGARVTSASLRVTVTRTPDEGGANSQFGLHRVLRPWSEGTQRGGPPGGALAQTDECTWFLRGPAFEPWAIPGGEPGVDYADDPSSTERILGRGAYEFEFGPVELAEIQAWIDRPDTNFGWMLKTQSEQVPRSARRFGSRENSDPGLRPRLNLVFSEAPTPDAPVLLGLELDPAPPKVHFRAQPGIRYTLEFSEDPAARTWRALGPALTTNATSIVTLTDSTPSASLHRFYRVEASP